MRALMMPVTGVTSLVIHDACTRAAAAGGAGAG